MHARAPAGGEVTACKLENRLTVLSDQSPVHCFQDQEGVEIKLHGRMRGHNIYANLGPAPGRTRERARSHKLKEFTRNPLELRRAAMQFLYLYMASL